MATLEAMDRVSSKAGPVSKCAGCPFAGLCTPCKPQSIDSKSLILSDSGFNKLLKEPELPRGRIYFDSSSAKGSEPRIRTDKETTCSICGESSSACPHLKTYKN